MVLILKYSFVWHGSFWHYFSLWTLKRVHISGDIPCQLIQALFICIATVQPTIKAQEQYTLSQRPVYNRAPQLPLSVVVFFYGISIVYSTNLHLKPHKLAFGHIITMPGIINTERSLFPLPLQTCFGLTKSHVQWENSALLWLICFTWAIWPARNWNFCFNRWWIVNSSLNIIKGIIFVCLWLGPYVQLFHLAPQSAAVVQLWLFAIHIGLWYTAVCSIFPYLQGSNRQTT